MQDSHPSAPSRMIQAADITALTSEVLQQAARLRTRIQELKVEHLGHLGPDGRAPVSAPEPEPSAFVPVNVSRLRAIQEVLREAGGALESLEASHGMKVSGEVYAVEEIRGGQARALGQPYPGQPIAR